MLLEKRIQHFWAGVDVIVGNRIMTNYRELKHIVTLNITFLTLFLTS